MERGPSPKETVAAEYCIRRAVLCTFAGQSIPLTDRGNSMRRGSEVAPGSAHIASNDPQQVNETTSARTEEINETWLTTM
jgi:hypothetical protein